MAYAIPKGNHISPFAVLLGTISRELSREHIRRIKILLRGHVNKENLGKLRGGFELVHFLQDRGLITEKKLSFFRKLLRDCELFSLVDLVDEYKQTMQVMNGKTVRPGR